MTAPQETTEILETAEFPFAGSSIDGPAPLYSTLRADRPVARVRTTGGVDAWLVTRYQDVRSALADPRLSRAETCKPGAPRIGGSMNTTPDMIISLDSTEHARLRKLVAGAFTVRRVELMRPRIQQIVDELLDDIAAKGSPANLVQQFALPLPLTVIGEMLGVPAEDLGDFEGHARAFATVDDGTGNELTPARMAQLHEFVVGLISAKRRQPADDMMSDLIAARDNDDRLSEEELVTFVFTLIGAGFDTTACQLANSVLALIHGHPDGWKWLAEDRTRIPAAVEELLRRVNLFATDTSGFHRIATEDLELGGVRIAAGEAVVLSIASANRDESVFADAGRLDLGRADNPHIAFGHGIHYCLGKQLARIEMHLALDGLVRRFPDLRLAVPAEELRWHLGEINHSLAALPVTWGN
ncbi:MAG: hypothetical protein QOF84_1122 [Streptomyces sp.]|nr:hypothetical protein [Streptomyces sp.]MDX6346332.1 hypothetical protein [Streptomyces sp.]